ncbi:hypothetical protein OAG57_05030 [Akkermansiaceae bacterium]|nr:hypothetical protein [Akkermansiaceae bacterium]
MARPTQPFKSGGNKLGNFDAGDYSESGEYTPSNDPLKPKVKDDFIGGDMHTQEILQAEDAKKGGSTAGGPLSNPTPYGDVGSGDAVPFEGQQRQMLSADIDVEKAIEDALDFEIDALEKAQGLDPVAEMKATNRIKELQGELTKAYESTKAKKSTMGDSYETRALRKRVQEASPKISAGDLELTIEDTKPLPTTSKGKGPGIKNAQSIIDTGIESRLISQKLIGGNKKNPNVEYSPAPSSLSQGNIETELRKGAKVEQYGAPIPEKGPNQNVSRRTVPYDFDLMKEMNPTSADKKGILGETSISSVAEDIEAEKAGRTSSLVDNKTGQPLLPKQPPVGKPTMEVGDGDFNYQTSIEGKKAEEIRKINAIKAREAKQNLPTIDDFDDDPGMEGYDPDSKSPKSGRRTFNKGTTVSGNIVNKTTPDNPRQVSSGRKPSIVNDFNKAKDAGLDSSRALKNAQRQAKLNKIKGKGKGKGKLATTLLVSGLSAYIAGQSDKLDK